METISVARKRPEHYYILVEKILDMAKKSNYDLIKIDKDLYLMFRIACRKIRDSHNVIIENKDGSVKTAMKINGILVLISNDVEKNEVMFDHLSGNETIRAI